MDECVPRGKQFLDGPPANACRFILFRKFLIWQRIREALTSREVQRSRRQPGRLRRHRPRRDQHQAGKCLEDIRHQAARDGDGAMPDLGSREARLTRLANLTGDRWP